MGNEKGASVPKMIGAIVGLMIALIGINLTLTLVKSLTETTAIGDDTESLQKLRDRVWQKCDGISGEGATSPSSITIDFDVKTAQSTQKNGDNLLMSFSGGKSRSFNLPDGCGVKFVEGNGGSLEPGNHDLTISGDADSDPPVVTVSVSEESEDSESD